MKNQLKAVTTAAAALCFAACGAWGMKGYAEQSAAISTSDVNPTWIQSYWTDKEGYAPAWTSEGVKMKVQGNTSGSAWTYAAGINGAKQVGGVFSITDNKQVSLKIKVLFPDDATASNNGGQFDFVFYGLNKNTGDTDGKELVRVRSWITSGGSGNADHSCAVYPVGDWGKSTDPGVWIAGSPYSGAEYAFTFDKENLVRAKKLDGSYAKLDDANGTIKNSVGNIDEYTDIWVKVVGDNGFNKPIDVTVTEVNGQSLGNTDGKLTDTVAPIIFDNGMASELEALTEYTLPAYASDLLCASTAIQYSVDFGDIAAEKYTYVKETRSVTFMETGTYTLTFKATDSAGLETSKEYNYTVKSASVPEISAPESIADISTKVWDKIQFPSASIDSGVVREWSLSIYKNYNPEEPTDPDYTATETDEGFKFVVPYGMESGTYTLVYSGSNASGSGKSTVEANITVAAFGGTDFISALDGKSNVAGGSSIISLVEGGVAVRANKTDASMKVGYNNLFSTDETVSLTIAVDKSESNLAYSGARPEMLIYNPTVYDAESNPSGSLDENGNLIDNYLAYGVWISGGSDGGDSATNVYIFNKGYQGNTWGDVCDCTDTGWINNAVGGKVDGERTFTMLFNRSEYFTSLNKENGKISAENASGQVGKAIDALMSEWKNVGALAYGFTVYNPTSSGDFRYTVKETNGVSLANADGKFTAASEARIYKGSVPAAVKVNEATVLNVFGKDLLSDAKMSLKITAPGGAETTVADGSFYSFTPSTTGDYKFDYEITGVSGNKKTESFTISVKDKLTNFDMTLAAEYAIGLKTGDEVTVIDLKDKTGVVGVEVLLTKPDGTTQTVSVGDTIKLVTAGIYRLAYTAYDDANPTRNEASVSIALNAIDETKPIITLNGLPENVKAGDTVTVPAVQVTEESGYTVTVTLIKPDGTKEVIANGKDGFTFTAQEGTYRIEIKVVDDYDNENTESFSLTVAAAEKSGGCGSVVGSMATGAIILLGIGVCMTIRRRKNEE